MLHRKRVEFDIYTLQVSTSLTSPTIFVLFHCQFQELCWFVETTQWANSVSWSRNQSLLEKNYFRIQRWLTGYFTSFTSSLNICERKGTDMSKMRENNQSRSVTIQNLAPFVEKLPNSTGPTDNTWTNVYIHSCLWFQLLTLTLLLLSSRPIRAVCQQNKRFSVKRVLNETVNCSVCLIPNTDATEI